MKAEHINEAFEMIEKFISRKYDALEFSYDFPDYLIEYHDDMRAENEKIIDLLDENFPEICAEYERGQDPSEFIQNVKKEYQFIKDAK